MRLALEKLTGAGLAKMAEIRQPGIVGRRAMEANADVQQSAELNEEEIQKRGLVLLEQAKRLRPHPRAEESRR